MAKRYLGIAVFEVNVMSGVRLSRAHQLEETSMAANVAPGSCLPEDICRGIRQLNQN